jgi:oxalate decarboxylase
MPNLKWSFADSHIRIEEGGWARETTIRELPISKAMAGVNMRLKAGAVREHWHKEAEWSYMLKGEARITAVAQAPDVRGRRQRRRPVVLSAGDPAFNPGIGQ